MKAAPDGRHQVKVSVRITNESTIGSVLSIKVHVRSALFFAKVHVRSALFFAKVHVRSMLFFAKVLVSMWLFV
jgi:hypothetical protein